MPTPKSPSKKNSEQPEIGKLNSSQFSGKESLREKADEILESKQSAPLSVRAERALESLNMPDEETKKLIYELEVHQIELEMQYNELQHANKKIESSAVKYAELYDFSPAGYFTLSREGEILELNLYASQMLGKNRSSLINSRFGFFVSLETRPKFNNFLETLFAFKSKTMCEITLYRENWKNPIYALLSGVVINGAHHCLIAAVDITEHKKAEEEIKIKTSELQRVNAEKDKFFSIIAHDLRSPFNGFLGLTELMSEGVSGMTSEEIQKIALIMKKSATNLNHLLGNLLEWSRMQRGLISFLPKTYQLKPLIHDSLNLIAESARVKWIELNFDIPNDLMVYADKNMLETLFRNLVSNAVKFTPRGGEITVSAKLLSDKSVEISIQDSGIGMNKDIQENLFELNAQTGRKGTDGELSTGLGLIICKDLIEKHNGKISIESFVGKGSNFRFTLPAQ